MTRQWTFAAKLGAGFTAAVVMLVAVCALAYRAASDLADANARVISTDSAVRTLADFIDDLDEAEIITQTDIAIGSEASAAASRTAIESISRSFEKLHAVPEIAAIAELPQMEAALKQELKDLADIAQTRRAEGRDAALKLIDEDNAEWMKIKQFDAGTRSTLVATLDREIAGANRSARDAQLTIGATGIAAAVLLALLGIVLSRTLGRQIGTAVSGIQSSASELQAASNQQASGSKEQAAATAEITTTIKELLSTSRQIADSAQSVARIAEETAASSRSGNQTVAKATEAVAGIRKQVDLIVSHMIDLSRKSQQIGSILEIITELSEQTNILAINASIESAGAGDAGRRFGVVADEIRKLADRVGGSTKDIRVLIDEIRAAATSAVMATENGSKSVDAGSRQFGEVAATFQQIAGQVTTTSEAAREIELSTKQQSSAVEQVNSAIASVAVAAREMEASTVQTLQTSTQLASLATDLHRLVRSRD